jgi:hypothetical protein
VSHLIVGAGPGPRGRLAKSDRRLSGVTPLQKVAMGFVIVLLDAPFGGYDGLPDPVGWGLVIAGLLSLRGLLRGADTLLGVAILSGLVSLVTYPPAVGEHLDPSLGWLLSLPQLAFSLLTCSALAPPNPDLERRFLFLRWVFVALAVAPVLVFGGGLDRLTTPTAVVAVLADLYFVYLVFRVSRRPFGVPGHPGPPPENG